jgi:RHS repeat-associated protein
MDYEYDLLSGNVHQVSYQAGQWDEFHHRYRYDADNRLLDVRTSRDGRIWERDARYFYYAHGPLARTELGDKQVQGTDHFYTIQGWLKGVNSVRLTAAADAGQDAKTTGLNKPFALDAMGYVLRYHGNDYSPGGQYLYFVKSGITLGGATHQVKRQNLTTTTVNTVVNNFGGDIRRTKHGEMLVATPAFLYPDEAFRIQSPNTASPSIVWGSFTHNDAKAEGALGLQPLVYELLPAISTRSLNQKRYELTDHLGNVRAVVSDRKLCDNSALPNPPIAYRAEVLNQTDFYPFGMISRSTNASGEDYRFGFNGKENDNQVHGAPGTFQDYGMRAYDPRLGRFPSVDPLTSKYPELTPYQFASNSPISGIDLDGLEYFYAADGRVLGHIGAETRVQVASAENEEAVECWINWANSTNPNMVATKDYAREMALKWSTSVGIDNAELNRRSLLGLLRRAEDGAYNKRIGGDTFEGNEHPGGRKLYFRSLKKYVYVSPAGAYQITEPTYKGYKDKNIVNDFSPQSQDRIAIGIIDAYHAREEVEAADVAGASALLKEQWSSLPGGSEQRVTEEEAGTILQEERAKELRQASEVQTPQGQLP